MDASHTLSTASKIAFGKIAQSHPAPAPTPVPPTRFPTKYTGTHVPALARIFNVIAARNAANVYTPKIRKIPAINSGYTGVIHAVGPVSTRNGDANPFPSASECAMLPDSNRNGIVPSARCGLWLA